MKLEFTCWGRPAENNHPRITTAWNTSSPVQALGELGSIDSSLAIRARTLEALRLDADETAKARQGNVKRIDKGGASQTSDISKDKILLDEQPHSNTFLLNMDNKRGTEAINEASRAFLIDGFVEPDASLENRRRKFRYFGEGKQRWWHLSSFHRQRVLEDPFPCTVACKVSLEDFQCIVIQLRAMDVNENVDSPGRTPVKVL